MKKQIQLPTENKFATIVHAQKYHTFPEFTLESGVTLHNVTAAYKTWGKLNATKDNVMVICHALTGSADVEDWWGPLIGKGRAFDTSKFFLFCGNVLGSPYGSTSPVTINPDTGRIYGPEFPLATTRDDVRLHKLVLDRLGARQIAIVVGGSMGGMAVLEWAFLGTDYVKTIVPVATSARHSAWCISWGEAQRQSIYSDPKYLDGYYNPNDPPNTGLAAARMAALLTYRSRISFESRFGRKYHDPSKNPAGELSQSKVIPTTSAEKALLLHNDGHHSENIINGIYFNSNNIEKEFSTVASPSLFSAQSYLRYQGEKFVKRFDANCYISLSRKMDAHDVTTGRGEQLDQVLSKITQFAMVIGIESDGLFTISEQQELADHMPNAEMVTIQSPEGHDGFLLEFDQINCHLLRFIKTHLPEIYQQDASTEQEQEKVEKLVATKNSLFGEAEVGDMLKW
ncbi:747_t:CDS:2 [Ambispora gerdemannii]|uniref:747_t:CDS:1 n=1 Tax=Ambispora gerdemannii TaxID=144530 RepID=A0A9N8V3N5_9GLOM|nr:747_t:CDS:2 [Ambispora gerdemannii]